MTARDGGSKKGEEETEVVKRDRIMLVRGKIASGAVLAMSGCGPGAESLDVSSAVRLPEELAREECSDLIVCPREDFLAPSEVAQRARMSWRTSVLDKEGAYVVVKAVTAIVVP